MTIGEPRGKPSPYERMGNEEHAAWWLRMQKPVGWTDLTIADLPEPEQVHPKRLLAELAEEFDRIEIW